MRSSSRRLAGVFVVEDSAEVRERLVGLIGGIEGVVLSGSAEAVATAVDGILRTRPDFVLLDLHLPDGSGMEVLRRVHGQAPEIAFIVLTNYPEAHYRTACLRGGARYFLDKNSEFARVKDIISATLPASRQAAGGPRRETS